MLRIAIPSKGKVRNMVLDLLNDVGLGLSIGSNDEMILCADKFPAEILLLEKELIPSLLVDGVVDVAVCDEYFLRHLNIPEHCFMKTLQQDYSSLSLLIPSESKYKGEEWSIGKRIATPYPELVEFHFKNRGLKVKVVPMRENAISALRMQVADAVCDVVDYESRLYHEHLKVAEKIMVSDVKVVMSPKIALQKKLILDDLILRVDSVNEAKGKRLVSFSIKTAYLDDIIQIFPPFPKLNYAMLGPDDLLPVTFAIDEIRLWDMVDHLRKLGVKEIVVSPVEKIIYQS